MTIIRANRARTVTLATASVLALGLALSGCAGGGTNAGGGASADQLTQALQTGGEITYWSWTPSAAAQVAAFQKAYPKVKVNLVNAGTNTTEYTKLQNAITAGSGAPDVAQVEYYAIPQFSLSESLLDLAPYGFGDLKAQYSAGPWGAVTSGDKVYGLPQDSGPMAMFYNKTVFDKYGIAVPKTYDEYYAAAQKLHAADPNAYITSDSGDAGFTTSMIWQAGGKPFQAEGTNVTIELQDAGSKKWTENWNRLVKGSLLSTTPGWSDDWFKGLGNGSIATLLTGAWMPGVCSSRPSRTAPASGVSRRCRRTTASPSRLRTVAVDRSCSSRAKTLLWLRHSSSG